MSGDAKSNSGNGDLGTDAALLPGERLVFQRRPHPVVVAVPLLGLALVLGSFLLLFCPQAHALALDGRCAPLTASVVGFVTGLVFLDWWLTFYILTTRRVSFRRGIVGLRLIEIQLADVQNVAVEQGVIGRMLGFGDVIIESAGLQGQVCWAAIVAPVQASRSIQTAVNRLEGASDETRR